MGKLYYCDYCDRSFIDDVQARKKHLKGIAHLRNRKLHYSSYRDLETLIEEESIKEECFKFKHSGQCQFGDDCYRSHFSKHQLDLFQKQIHEEKSRKMFQDISELKTIESWLAKRSTIAPFRVSPDVKTSHINYVSYIPQNANVSQNLPLSLQSFQMSDFKDAEVPEWS